MNSRSRHLLLLLAWLALTVAGCVVGAQVALEAQRTAFSTEAEGLHRLLSLQIRQHESLLETVALLQPADVPGAGLSVGQSLTALHPALQQVLRRDEATPWPHDLALALASAEQRSRVSLRAVSVDLDPAGGSVWLVRSGQPASFAAQIDLRQLSKAVLDGPFAGQTAVTAWLEKGGQRRLVLTGQNTGDLHGAWRHGFRQTLNSQTLTMDLVAVRRLDLLSLPWLALAGWCLLTSFLALGTAAWWQARREGEVPDRSPWDAARAPRVREIPARVARQMQPVPAATGWPANSPQPLRVTLRELDLEPPELTVARGAISQAARHSRRDAAIIANLRRNAENPVREDRLQPVRWDEVLRDALELVEAQCAHQGVVTTLATDDEAASVVADRVALEQVVGRLLDQALQALSAVPDGERRLDMTLTPQGECAVLSVSDSGVPPAEGDGLLQPGQAHTGQAPGPRAHSLQGCAQLLAGMSGHLQVEPASPRGAIVRVALPRALS